MNRILFWPLVCVPLVCSMLMPSDARAGYHIFLHCEYGLGVAPSGPNPNILCEYTWENTGPNFVNHGDGSGTLVYQPNPAIRDEFITPRFDFRNTAQPLIQHIGCSDVSGIMTMTVFAKSYLRELRQGYFSIFDFISDTANGNIIANGC